MPGTQLELAQHQNLFVKQVREMAEWFGFETRNKYQISDQNGLAVGFAAEQSKGFIGFLLRQFLGHWRTFEIHIFTPAREKVMTARRPFRFLFQRLEILDGHGKQIGAIQQRFSILTKRFDVQNARGMTIMEVASPFWKLWTFPFRHQGKEVASIKKKWSGLFSEAFTDRDNFMVEFSDPSLSNDERNLIAAAAIFVDLQYFEKKAGN